MSQLHHWIYLLLGDLLLTSGRWPVAARISNRGLWKIRPHNLILKRFPGASLRHSRPLYDDKYDTGSQLDRITSPEGPFRDNRAGSQRSSEPIQDAAKPTENRGGLNRRGDIKGFELRRTLPGRSGGATWKLSVGPVAQTWGAQCAKPPQQVRGVRGFI